MKNKTVAAWLAFLGGPLGLHCFYLRGFGSMLGWMLPIPTAPGLGLRLDPDEVAKYTGGERLLTST